MGFAFREILKEVLLEYDVGDVHESCWGDVDTSKNSTVYGVVQKWGVPQDGSVDEENDDQPLYSGLWQPIFMQSQIDEVKHCFWR